MRHRSSSPPSFTSPRAPGPAALVREPVWGRLRSGSAVIAALATIGFHLALILAAPAELARTSHESRAPHPSLQVILESPPEQEPDESLPEQFVVPAPDVPSHPPESARHFAERDQEAAQPEAAEEDLGTPEVEGELDGPTQYIVDEQTSEPVPVPPEEEWEIAGSDFGFPGIDGRPVEGFDEAGEEDEGTEVPVTQEPVERESDRIEIALNLDGLADFGEEAEEGRDAEAVPTPQPRPRVSQRAAGPVGTRPGGVSRIGTLSVDANFSEFGDYLTRMLEAVSRRWHDLAWEALPSGEVGTIVLVSFQIDRDGRVHNATVEHSTASLTATLICKDAITSRQPYGSWSRDMQEVLGEEQTVRIRFHYR